MESEVLKQRVIAQFCSNGSGPIVIVVAAMHGNEPNTVIAAERVAAKLRLSQTNSPVEFSGDLLMLIGNRQALAEDVRQIDRDLNRLWSTERTNLLEDSRELPGDWAEDQEQAEVFKLIDPLLAQADSRAVYFLDLHSSSSDGAPFLVTDGSEQSSQFAERLPVPSIGGLESEIENVLAWYAARRGACAVVFEGGWHYSPATADSLEALLWLSLVECGAISRDSLNQLEQQKTALKIACQEIGRKQEVIYQHRICPEDRFLMRPGFQNFQKVKQGQFLAVDKNGPIVAVSDGRVFMPLYQSTGSEGFLLTRDKD